MPRTRKTNRDHARKQQRPMMEDEVIAAQLERLVTPAIIERNVDLITRLNNGASFTVERILTNSYSIRDRIVSMGAGNKKTPWIAMRLVEIKSGKTWHSYLTSVLDPLILPPYVVADLYGRR